MELGMIGLGRMGANMVRRLMGAGHRCVVHDLAPEAVSALEREGAAGAATLDDLVRGLAPPRIVWMMVPAAVVERTVSALAPRLERGDILVDGGNSWYADDIRRAAELSAAGIRYVDVGTSGGLWGKERGYCLMIGGDAEAVRRLDPVFRALAPPMESAPRTPGREGAAAEAEGGYLHCGPAGAGHFVKMVHNGIEYGLMEAYAEGFNILRQAGAGGAGSGFRFPLADIAEVWRRGSVVSSWLLDLTAASLHKDPELSKFEGRVSDSGEGRWTVHAAVDEGVPAPVLTAALYQRFSSRGGADFAGRLLSAMRYAFGGHAEKG
ncbi:MAG: phosphogluconate dehydrogenase (NAD(+)-dependent, decarboxylating) [Thermodesulfobacteriota bacterium]